MMIVVMGVSGAGKSVVGAALATTLGLPFQEGDAFHAPVAIASMRAGVPLDDAARAPWLDRVAAWMRTHRDGGVIACSALRRRYRDRLRADVPDALFVLLDVDIDELRRRITTRPGHFMPAGLLDSQLATLELPDADERALVVRDAGGVDATVAAVRRALGR